MAKPTKKTKGTKKRERRERRFLPRASTNPTLVKGLGALGAMALGAGAMGYWGRPEGALFNNYATWIGAAGFLVFGVAVWLGTTGDAALRVGDAGLAWEKGSLRRIAWHAVSAITWEAGNESLVVSGE